LIEYDSQVHNLSKFLGVTPLSWLSAIPRDKNPKESLRLNHAQDFNQRQNGNFTLEVCDIGKSSKNFSQDGVCRNFKEAETKRIVHQRSQQASRRNPHIFNYN